LKEKIQTDLDSALKEKREIEVSILRMLKASVFNKEKEKRYKLTKGKSDADLEKMGKESAEAKKLEKESELTDEEILDTISSEIKKIKEAQVLFEKGKREDLIKKSKAELEVLQKYLPAQISEDEIKKIITEAIKKTGAKEMKDMGKVMGMVTQQAKGKADMSQVSKIVKELLS
ncbi:MAG: GatB/YqeY domain-containing protein, partial [Candidatus Pacebacteria bacterium]|nr:GatB/YqeY domain-containing protein [Candidatus Paceibacterota bacterium]